MAQNNKITCDKYLIAVRRAASVNDADVALRLGVDRATVWRFRTKNPECFDKAEALLLERADLTFNRLTKPSTDSFRIIPAVADWIETLKKRRVADSTLRSNLGGFLNVCHELRTHPEKVTVDQCADLVQRVRDLEDRGVAVKAGLKFLTIRGGIRSWFMLFHGISGELLSAKGIDAGRSKGSGSFAKERVTQEQRELFDKYARRAVVECAPKTEEWNQEKIDKATLEIQGLAWYMYYTGTRIAATLAISLDDPAHKLTKNYWEIHVLDKGKKGGLHWQKMLIEHSLAKIKEYLSMRFDIPIEDLETELPKRGGLMFPIMQNYELECKIMRRAQKFAGCTFKMQNHIWRHTFAQDSLHATDWNYELCAEIGGWSDTGTMKRSYGKMSAQAVDRGLRRAMGLKVEEVTYTLKW